MKLKKLQPVSTGRGNNTPTMTIGKSGRIGFNKPAIHLLGLAEGIGISFFEDEDDAGVWYVGIDKEGIKVRRSFDKKSLLIQSQAIVTDLCSSMRFADKRGQCIIAGVPTVVDKRCYFGLIPKHQKK
jgi:hypothetical protein